MVIAAGALVAMALVDVWLLAADRGRGLRRAGLGRPRLPRGPPAVAAGAGGGGCHVRRRGARPVRRAHHPRQRGDRAARSPGSGPAPAGRTRPASASPGSRRMVSPIGSIAVQGAFLAVLGVGGYRVASGSITVAALVAFILYLFLLVMPLGRMIGAWTQLQTGLGALTRIQEILALGPGATTSAPERPATRCITRHRQTHRCWSWTTSRSPTPTGGRCSTGSPCRSLPAAGSRWSALRAPGSRRILALIEGFYPLDGGVVRWAGTDVREMPRAALRARLGYVEQEAPVLAGTIRDNLLLTRPDATDLELWAVLADVGLTDVVRRSPRGPGRAGRGRGCPAVRRRAPAPRDRTVAAGAARSCSCSTSRPPASTPGTRACCATPSPLRRPTARCWWSPTGCPPCSTATRSWCSTPAGWSPAARTPSWSTPAPSTASWRPPSCSA